MQQHRHFREQIKQQHRQRLQHLGLAFCDDNASRMQKVEAAYRHVRGVWEVEAGNHIPVLAHAVDASTTDNELQSIDNTLTNDRHFWSSTGSVTQIDDEALLYELKGPASQVAFVQMAVYRAFYQHGYPVYPPLQLQIWVGPSPVSLTPGSPILDVQSTDALQTFALYADAPIAKYLQVRMYGKQQKQQEDMQFYTAIRYVAAVGRTLTASQVTNSQGLLRSGVLRLSPGGRLPGSCATALSNASEHGVALRDAATAAAAWLLRVSQQQQQQPAVKGVEELIERQQRPNTVQQQPWPQRRNERASQQQQQRSIGSGGFWSALGRSFSRSRDSRTKPNDSSAGDTSHAAAAAAAALTQASEFVGSSSNSGGGVAPRWLPAGSAADAHEHLTSAAPQEWQQQQQCKRRQILPDFQQVSESDDESDLEFEEHDVGERMDVSGLMAQRDQFEFMLMQAIQRLDDPNQLEHVLAAWLQDEPLANTVPGTLVQQHAREQQPAGSGSSKAANCQTCHAWGMPAAAAALAVGLHTDRSNSSSSGGSAIDEQQPLAEGPVAATCDSAAAAAAEFDASYRVSCKVELQANLLLPLPGVSTAAAGAFGRSAAVAADAAMAAIAHGSSPQQAAEVAAAAAAASQSCAMQAASVRLRAKQLFRLVDRDVSVGRVPCTQQQIDSWYEEGIEEDLWLHHQVVGV